MLWFVTLLGLVTSLKIIPELFTFPKSAQGIKIQLLKTAGVNKKILLKRLKRDLTGGMMWTLPPYTSEG